LVEMYKTDFYE
jgi:hypothetical protein